MAIDCDSLVTNDSNPLLEGPGFNSHKLYKGGFLFKVELDIFIISLTLGT